jgi:hypothetical protein
MAVQAPSEAGDSDMGDPRSRRSQRAKAEVWKGRSAIIEEMNELLDELDVRVFAHYMARAKLQHQS